MYSSQDLWDFLIHVSKCWVMFTKYFHVLASLFISSASDESRTSKSNEKRLSTGSRPNIALVKWQQNSLQTPLLRLPPDLAALALECFDCILRYCGDLMVETDLTEVKCVYTILMVRPQFTTWWVSPPYNDECSLFDQNENSRTANWICFPKVPFDLHVFILFILTSKSLLIICSTVTSTWPCAMRSIASWWSRPPRIDHRIPSQFKGPGDWWASWRPTLAARMPCGPT